MIDFYELTLPLFSVDEMVGQKEVTQPMEKKNVDKSVSPLNSIDDDIRSLEELYGPMKPGMQINMTLQEILGICYRRRERCDAYRKLQKELDKRFGVKLIITSRKGGKNG